MAVSALANRRKDATAARLAGLSVPHGATWATEARRAAVARVIAMGLPQKRDEYWRYTDPASLTAEAATPVPVLPDDAAPVFAEVDRLRIIFVDGVFDAAQSDPLELAGVEIETLASASAKDIHWVKDLLGAVEVRAHTPVARSLAALNTGFATEGVVIRVVGKAARPVALVYVQRSEVADAMVHHLIRLEAGAELTLLESGPAAARVSMVTEVDIGAGARLSHVRAQGPARERRSVTHSFVKIGAESSFKSFTLTANGRMTRNECVIELTGDDAVAHVAGASIGDGPDFNHDDTVFITHDAQRCESRQVFKKVLRNGATGVFQGKILVKQGAQKTDGYQISQALLMDDDSQFLAKPELEIYADDVACSHGSTSGAIDETALFYLRSRGVPEAEATDLLTLAFLAEALAEIEDPALAVAMQAQLELWLVRRG